MGKRDKRRKRDAQRNKGDGRLPHVEIDEAVPEVPRPALAIPNRKDFLPSTEIDIDGLSKTLDRR